MVGKGTAEERMPGLQVPGGGGGGWDGAGGWEEVKIKKRTN